jgi:hypothetical protein
MQHFSAITIFCEDIREEKSGQDSIVGTLPDNLIIGTSPTPGASAMLPKFCTYIRINFDVEHKPNELSVKLIDAKDAIISLGGWEQPVIDKAFSDAAGNQMPIVGLIWKMIAAPFPIVAAGKITAKVIVNGTEYVAGVINIIGPSATVSPPPA